MWLTEGFGANLVIYDSLELPSNKGIMNYFSKPGIWLLFVYEIYIIFLISDSHFKKKQHPTAMIPTAKSM